MKISQLVHQKLDRQTVWKWLKAKIQTNYLKIKINQQVKLVLKTHIFSFVLTPTGTALS